MPSTAGSQLHCGRPAEIQSSRDPEVQRFRDPEVQRFRGPFSRRKTAQLVQKGDKWAWFHIISIIHADRNLAALQLVLLASGVPSFRDIPLSVQAKGDRAQGVLISAVSAVCLAPVKSVRAKARRMVIRMVALQLYF